MKNKRVGEDECEEGTFYLEDASAPHRGWPPTSVLERGDPTSSVV